MVWLCVGAFVLLYMQFTRENVTGTIHFLARLDAKVNVPKLFAYLRSKGVTCEDVVAEPRGRLARAVMTRRAPREPAGRRAAVNLWERWYGPDVILTVDVRNGVLANRRHYDRQTRVFARAYLSSGAAGSVSRIWSGTTCW